MNVLIGSLCLLLSIQWTPVAPEADPTLKRKIQEAWQKAVASEEAGLSAGEAFGQLSEAVKNIEDVLGREKMILQCVLIMADTHGSHDQHRAYMEASVTLGRVVQPTPLELVEVLGKYWPIEDGGLKNILIDIFSHISMVSYDKVENAGTLDVFASVLSNAWLRRSDEYNGLIDYMFAEQPVEAWRKLAEIDDRNDIECEDLVGQLLPVKQVSNDYFVRNPERLPNETHEKARALLRECAECTSLWPKIFVAEVLLRVESMRDDELLEVLREEECPFVVRRMELIEEEKEQGNRAD